MRVRESLRLSMWGLMLALLVGCTAYESEGLGGRNSDPVMLVAENEASPKETQLEVSREDAIAIALRVAREQFGGKGVAGGPLDFGGVSVRLVMGGREPKHNKDTWYANIPETSSPQEPSGLLLLIDSVTGEWSAATLE